MRDPSSSLHGRLAVLAPDGRRATLAPSWPGGPPTPTLLSALENWRSALPALRKAESDIKAGRASAFALGLGSLMAPLPRSYAFLDGSAYLEHVRRARKARAAEPPPELETVPLMYQGASAPLSGPREPMRLPEGGLGLDFEAEIVVFLDEVPLGTRARDAARHIKLIGLMNDVTLRELLPREAATGFGFVQSKPPSAFAPFVVTPQELGPAWRDGRPDLKLLLRLNGRPFGDLSAFPMHFSFPELIAHAARTRALAAGTILGGGTVSNPGVRNGFACIAERRMVERIAAGAASTPFLKRGDRVEIEAVLGGRSVFGKIEQRVV